MKRNTFFSGVVSMGLVCLFAFSGCEEGLGSGTYSFSDMYERMNVMEAEIERLKATSDRVDIIGGMTDYGSSISSLQIEQSDNTQRVSALESRVGDFSSSALDLQEEIQNLKLKTSPPGTINPFAGVNVPEGWLLCDGQAYGRTEHSELFQVIGTAWGSPDDSRFNVPDLRGVFLRGLDRGTGKDPDAGSRVAIMPRGNTGNNVGSYQDDAFQGHKHHTSNGMTIGGDGSHFPWGNGAKRTYYSNTAGSISAGYGTPRMSDETRSKNAAVNYIIKL